MNDNELYDTSMEVVSVFVFQNMVGPSTLTSVLGNDVKSLQVGPHQMHALIHAVHNLRNSLQDLRADMIVRQGDTCEIIPAIARQLQVDEVAWSEEPGFYECQNSQKMKQVLSRDKNFRPRIVTVCGYCLYHPEDLPKNEAVWSALARPKDQCKKASARNKDKLDDDTHRAGSDSLVDVSRERFSGMCGIMGDFRRAARSYARIRPLFSIAKNAIMPSDLEVGEIPDWDKNMDTLIRESLLGLPPAVTERIIRGACKRPRLENEQEALQLLDTFCNEHASTANRNLADVSGFNSSRLSTFLALGILSPRQVYYVAQKHSGCEWLISHIEMRDFFSYNAWHCGARLYRSQGCSSNQKSVNWKPFNAEQFEAWATGRTGFPLIDAGMRELIETGYCSNRVRQNMASFLTKDLQLDWRLGAEWFQVCLEDHCVAANYGNWSYFAGVGADPKSRHFRTISQAIKYDPHGHYVRKWLAELDSIVGPESHLRPWDYDHDWPKPIVDPLTQYVWQDHQRLEESSSVINIT